MFGRHESLIDGGADGAARSLQASLLRPPPLRGPIAEFVGTIAQLPLPWRPQYRDLVRMGVTLLSQSSRPHSYLISGEQNPRTT